MLYACLLAIEYYPPKPVSAYLAHEPCSTSDKNTTAWVELWHRRGRWERSATGGCRCRRLGIRRRQRNVALRKRRRHLVGFGRMLEIGGGLAIGWLRRKRSTEFRCALRLCQHTHSKWLASDWNVSREMCVRKLAYSVVVGVTNSNAKRVWLFVWVWVYVNAADNEEASNEWVSVCVSEANNLKIQS